MVKLVVWSCSLFFVLNVQSQMLEHNSAIKKCRQIINSEQRLVCYDQIDDFPQTSMENSEQPQLQIPALLADIEEPRIFSSYGRMHFLDNDLNAVLLGVGARAKLKTIDIPKIHQSVNFNMIGLIKSQFDVSELDTRNNRGGALINTDFMIGGELVKNFAGGNVRFQYKHQSYHLGDEFLIDDPSFLEKRLNLSYETIEMLGFKKINNWGTYFGVSYIVRSEPGNLDKVKVQTGFQYHGQEHAWFTPLFGVDLKAWDETGWTINTSVKAGVEFFGFLDQPLQLLFEYSGGKSPYGQFIYEDLEFFGVSINHYW